MRFCPERFPLPNGQFTPAIRANVLRQRRRAQQQNQRGGQYRHDSKLLFHILPPSAIPFRQTKPPPRGPLRPLCGGSILPETPKKGQTYPILPACLPEHSRPWHVCQPLRQNFTRRAGVCGRALCLPVSMIPYLPPKYNSFCTSGRFSARMDVNGASAAEKPPLLSPERRHAGRATRRRTSYPASSKTSPGSRRATSGRRSCCPCSGAEIRGAWGPSSP